MHLCIVDAGVLLKNSAGCSAVLFAGTSNRLSRSKNLDFCISLHVSGDAADSYLDFAIYSFPRPTHYFSVLLDDGYSAAPHWYRAVSDFVVDSVATFERL